MSSSMDFPGDRQWLWLDYSDYAGRLLGGGEAPWCDAAELIAWYRKAQGLLGADVIALPVGRVAAAWAREHAAVREAMAAGADMLVKGGYTQSRVRQMIFGGATSHILANAELPVFMAH